MSRVRILIVENEAVIAMNIFDILEDLGYDVLEPATTYVEALDILKRDQPDIAILDIRLSGKKTGIDLARYINEEYELPFIFLTSNSDAATIDEAKKTNPAAFLVKPFVKDELFASIEIALHNYKQQENTIQPLEDNPVIKNALFIKEKGVFHKIMIPEIMVLKSEHVYIRLTIAGGKNFLIRGSFASLAPALSDAFIKVHRSYMINADFLENIGKTSVLIGKFEIPVSQRHREELLSKINIH